MQNKRSEFHHEIEHAGQPPISNMEDYRSLEDFLKSLDPDAEALDDIQCAPPVAPSRIFQIASLPELLVKLGGPEDSTAVDGGNYYYNDDLDLSLPLGGAFPKGEPAELPPYVTFMGKRYRLRNVNADYPVTEDPAPSSPTRTETVSETGVQPVGPEEFTEEQAAVGQDAADEHKEELASTKAEIVETFKRAKELSERFKSDKRFETPGVFGDGVLADWVTGYEADADKLKSKTDLDDAAIKELSTHVNALIASAEAALKTVNDKTVSIPNGADIYYMKEKMVAYAHEGMEGFPVSSETSEHDGKQVESILMLTPDGEEFVILKSDLERGGSKKGSTTFIPEGTLVLEQGTSKPIETSEDILGTWLGREYQEDPTKYGFPKSEDKKKTVQFVDFADLAGQVWMVRRLDLRKTETRTASIETTEDRPPYAWRDYPETQEITVDHSPVDGDEPFAQSTPSRGPVPFLSMPNVGDVMTDRTNTRGHAGDAEYLGKNEQKLDEERSKTDLKRKMKARYESDLTRAMSENRPRLIIKHYEEMIDRYQADEN